MNRFRDVVISLLGGALLGVLVASGIAAKFITWYNEPGAGGALCNCHQIAESTVGSVYKAQIIGAVGGAVVLLIVYVVVSVSRRRPSLPTAPPPAQPG